MSAEPPEEHRYLARIRTLSERVNRLLMQGDQRLHVTVLGVDHTGHILPDAVPSLSGADLVTLELPTTPVKAYLAEQGAGEGGPRIHIRNIFWVDILEHFRRNPCLLGVRGVNVNPHVRYLRGRLYYRGDFMCNDFEAPPIRVSVPSDRTYSLRDLGGEGEERVTAAEVLARVPPEAVREYEKNRVAHVGAPENPFGTGRHLVLYEDPPAAVLALEARAQAMIRSLAEQAGLPELKLRDLIHSHLLEGFLIAVSDFYLVEELLSAIAKALPHVDAGRELRVTHVAGAAHLFHLLRYLAPLRSSGATVSAECDPRFPIHPAYLFPDFFARNIDAALSALSLRGTELALDVAGACALLEEYAREEAVDIERRILLRAIWSRDRPRDPEADFHTLAEERPLEPGTAYGEQLATRWNWLLTEYLLAELPLPTLRAVNGRLAGTGRRGHLSAVTQEMAETGVGYQAFKDHPVVGYYTGLLEELWLAPPTDETIRNVLRKACAHRRAYA